MTTERLSLLLNLRVIRAEKVGGWWLVECVGGKSFWVHEQSEKVLVSARNW